MKLTQFIKLRHALTNLDLRFFARKTEELEERLGAQGQPWEPDNTAITEEGIFYINPESGMTTKVVLYQADQFLTRQELAAAENEESGAFQRKLSSNLNPYHLLRCNALTKASSEGATEGYKIAQRLDASFYYRFLKPPGRGESSAEVYREAMSQKLLICPNCFFKVTSLLVGVKDLTIETFVLEKFFNVDFFRSWSRYGERAKGGSSLASMYPKDWEVITKIRKDQVQYHCEGCGADLSSRTAQKGLRINPIDHTKRKIRYVRLQCLCPECFESQALPSTRSLPASP